MKILLIQPPSSDPLTDQIFLFEPLALEYLGAGLLQDGHTVELLDARLEPDVDSIFSRFQPELVGLTGFTSHVNIIKGIAARLKKLSPELFIVVGGHHATVQPEDFNEPSIDMVVVGEGVFTPSGDHPGGGARKRLRGDQRAGRSVPERDALHRTATVHRPQRPPFSRPEPDSRYRKHYFSEWFSPLASVRTSLGCTARCNFCALWGITGGSYLRRDPEAVVEELKAIAEQNVFFCDDESMCDVKRMDRLADLIREAGIRKNYFLYGRVDTIVNHPELFAKWAEIGLAQVFVGMEDFSDERLRAMRKGVTVAQQEKAVKILDELGIMMYASYMVDPAYTREDFRALLAHARRLKHKYATFTVMTPLPGTELHAARKKELLSQKPELYDMIHALLPTTLPLPEFYQELANLWVKAVPLYRVIPTLARFGPRGMLLRIKLLGRFLDKARAAHLDY